MANNHQRPSEGWLKNPAWIDGGVNPPRFYYSQEEINAALLVAGVTPRTEYDQQAARVTPTPSRDDPPAPLTPSLINGNSNHYRAAGTAAASPTSVGHLVSVTLVYPGSTAPSTAHSKAAPKKGKITKLDTIILSAISRVDFIKAILKIQGLAETFSPGVNSGTNFKVWWTGASGGKGGAPSVQNDHQFGIVLEALLKKEKKVQVSVEIDLDDMEGFRIKHLLPSVVTGTEAAGTEEELVYGTRIPQVEGFSDMTQLHGRFILELKKKWPCQQHQGEHGEPGFCYVNQTSEHTRLNPLRLKTWAAALAAGDATKHEPPSVTAFDGARDARLTTARPRGRTGPAPPTSLATPQANAEMMALIMSALIPVLGGLSRKRSRSESPTPVAVSTPKRIKLRPSAINSPLPEDGLELRACLRDFAVLEGVDLLSHEAPLQLEDYTPDVIPFVKDADLCRLTGITGGVAIKLKRFCKDWHNRYEKKRNAPK